MNVLIVGRTVMRGGRCIGGLAEDGRSLRLLTAAGTNWTADAPLQVGQVWDLRFTPVAAPVAPHVEDVIVTGQRFVAVQPDLRQHLLGRLAPWRGGADKVFGGLVGYTGKGNGYIAASIGIPAQSTGYWIPDRDLALDGDGKHYRYSPTPYVHYGLSYVGEPTPPPALLPAGTLVRVSLARWWRPDDSDMEERCYLQLSGWY